MFKRPPAAVGDPPPRVIFEGVGDQQEAQRLYRELSGPIGAFLRKARQSREISDQPGAHMQQALPDSGRLTYDYNHGQETIRVRLRGARSTTTTPSPRQLVCLPRPRLAIDVLLTPETYIAKRLYADVPGSTPPPSHWTDRSNWTLVFDVGGWGSVDALLASYPDSTVVRRGWFWVLDTPDNQEDYNSTIGPYFGAQLNITDDVEGNPIAPVAEIDDPDSIQRSNVFVYAAALQFSDGSTGTVIAIKYTVTTPDEPRPESTLEQIEYFNTLFVAGVVGFPESPQPVTATSLGVATSDQLVPMQPTGAKVSTTREIEFEETALTNVIGAGFLVRPPPSIPLGVMDFDIYISSSNNAGKNTYEDKGPLEYTEKPNLQVTVRVREYTEQDPVAVRVTTDTQKRVRNSQDIGVPSPGDPVDSFPGRTVAWAFAATKGWTDARGEPADPLTKPAMGEKLEELAIDRGAVATAPHVEFLRQEAVWAGAVTGMTPLCRIRWTPPLVCGAKGKATITALPGIQPPVEDEPGEVTPPPS